MLALEVYDNGRLRRSAPHTITVTASLRATDGRMIPLAAEQRSAAAARNAAGGHAFAFPLPFGDVSAGVYALRVEAVSSSGAGFTTAREIPVQIR
jgi:hypothetical protein